jgi:hypothetical protein
MWRPRTSPRPPFTNPSKSRGTTHSNYVIIQDIDSRHAKTNWTVPCHDKKPFDWKLFFGSKIDGGEERIAC